MGAIPIKSDTATNQCSRAGQGGLPLHLLETKNEQVFFMVAGVMEKHLPTEQIAEVDSIASERDRLRLWEEVALSLGDASLLLESQSASSESPDSLTVLEHSEDIEVEQPIPEIDRPTLEYRLGNMAIEAVGVIRADSLPGEDATRQRYNAFLDSIKGSPDMPDTVHRSSLDLLRVAASGGEAGLEAFKALLVDAQTHVYEVYGGVGEGMSVQMDLDENGHAQWAGQTTEDRQYHVLTAYANQASSLRKAVHAEGLNGFRVEDLNSEGLLEGKIVFDFSAMSSEATQKELSEWGFFLNSIACSIRGTRFIDSRCEVSSVFVAGVDQRQVVPRPSETDVQEIARQERALQLRFDLKVLRKMYVLFGVENATNMGATEILATPLIAPDTLDVLDMVMLYDMLAAEEVEDEAKTFFGSAALWQTLGSPEQLTRKHYEQHMQQREERQFKYDVLCEEIVREQVRRQAIAQTPREAVELKRRVVLDLTVEHAARDSSIDAFRFGRLAGSLIEVARQKYAQGDIDGGDKLVDEAKTKAVDPSCPPGERNKTLEGNEEDKKPESDSKTGIIRCIKCRKNVNKKDVVKSDCWECPKCGHKVDICSGETLREGQDSSSDVAPRPKKVTIKPFDFSKS